MSKVEELEKQLAAAKEEEEAKVVESVYARSVDEEEYVDLNSFGTTEERVIYEKNNLKYFVKENGKKKLLIGSIKITDTTYTYLLDAMTAINKLDKVTRNNINEVTTMTTIDNLLKNCFTVRDAEYDDVYHIEDPVEKMKTIDMIFHFATPSIKEIEAAKGNRANRRAYAK